MRAFENCKKLKTLVIKTTKLTASKLGDNAFAGIHSKAVIKVPKAKLSAYKTLLKKKGITLSQAIASIERYKNSGEINYRIEDKQGAMDAVREYFISQENPTAVMDFDGYRVEVPKWWFNIRPSNTEPYLRFICEAQSDELLNEKIAAVDRILSEQFGGKRS